MRIKIRESFRVPGTDRIIREGQTLKLIENNTIPWYDACTFIQNNKIDEITLFYPSHPAEELNLVEVGLDKLYFKYNNGKSFNILKSDTKEIIDYGIYHQEARTLTIKTTDSYTIEIIFK